MKAYRNELGQVTMFRPDMNMKRMVSSAERVALPVCISSWVALGSAESL
jgi:branched-subunit amino acid aminotransferase/4-amino-4-deoxychorismate lyase